ncbi:hypothetical protein NEOLI_002515 [Neolecta irregularis DAH-3]|uniref:Uncharacterized protein n=1 Tax=Neolecta irregularis (strain DAH-3) TaxID=1198029 RepID=A0A1U7LI50_NEOID|nr:hypothetical protein NEOLI_002515 [Neolecta irregularis DAH-3]|eukprot:OLL22336.1 hypothetical protein NEOLI_002515 [Neolecta irregularis DAH-3]
MPIIGAKPKQIPFPEHMFRLKGSHNPIIEHMERLQKNKSYRLERRHCIVQGKNDIRALIRDNVPISGLGISAPEEWWKPNEVLTPAIDVIRNPEKWPATRQYLVSIDMTRKILGSQARPAKHDLWAEVPFPDIPYPAKGELKRLICLNHVNSGQVMGLLIRTARALGWQAAYTMRGSIDFYDPQAICMSRAHTLRFPHIMGTISGLFTHCAEMELTPIITTPLPRSQLANAQPNQLHFWRPDDSVVDPQTLPKSIAFVVGTKSFRDYDPFISKNAIYMALPMPGPQVNSVNVGSLASIGLFELNRLTGWNTTTQKEAVELEEEDEDVGFKPF